ncbi:MAG: hypothetical protein HKN33_11380 [Pyrinomonadaceae bacterium]|nr:hypothetical protein [Pyrinomonadaceae bacterium]
MKRLITICAMLCIFALTATGQYEGETITEGVGIDDLKVGETTRDLIVAKYGNEYELIVHKKYSFELDYASKGMSFYFCQADPRQEVFVIELSYPHFSGVTSKGAILGQSTRTQVGNLYKVESEQSDYVIDEEFDGGTISTEIKPEDLDAENLKGVKIKSLLKLEPQAESDTVEDEFKGIEFEYGTIDGYGDNVLTSIDIIEKSGLRQCDSKFGKLEDK